MPMDTRWVDHHAPSLGLLSFTPALGIAARAAHRASKWIRIAWTRQAQLMRRARTTTWATAHRRRERLMRSDSQGIRTIYWCGAGLPHHLIRPGTQPHMRERTTQEHPTRVPLP